MSNIDRAIREALSKEDAEFLARFEDHSTPVGEVLDTFRGRWAWLNAFAAIITFAAFGFFVYAMLQIMGTTDIRLTVLWSAGAIISPMFCVHHQGLVLDGDAQEPSPTRSEAA